MKVHRGASCSVVCDHIDRGIDGKEVELVALGVFRVNVAKG